MAEHQVEVHEVELLSVSTGKIDGRPVAIITIRPELPSFRPHNVAIVRSSAERLLEDLKAVLSRSAVCLILMALVGMVGCSADVEVETQTTSSRPEAAAEPEALTTEKTRTAVSVDLFREQGPVVMKDGRLVDVPHDDVLVVQGCVHLHEHLHIYLCEGDRRRVALEIVREWSGGDCGRD